MGSGSKSQLRVAISLGILIPVNLDVTNQVSMSRAWVALTVSTLATITIVAYVHYDQQQELARMRQSVFDDAVREEARRQAVAEQVSNESPSSS